jgi:hypothetical protein
MAIHQIPLTVSYKLALPNKLRQTRSFAGKKLCSKKRHQQSQILGLPDDILQEDLENTPGLLIDQTTDTLDSSSPRQTPDGGLGNSLDVVSQHLAVALGATLSQALSSLSSSRHAC